MGGYETMTINTIGLNERDLKFAEDLNITDEIEICIDYLKYELGFDKDEVREFVERLLNKIATNYKNKLIDFIAKRIVEGDTKQ